jgi:hypothetical protein
LGRAATTRFKLSDIEDATNRFERTIGSGAFATVYHGKLADETEIAAKLLKGNDSQGNEDFLKEVSFMYIVSFDSSEKHDMVIMISY